MYKESQADSCVLLPIPTDEGSSSDCGRGLPQSSNPRDVVGSAHPLTEQETDTGMVKESLGSGEGRHSLCLLAEFLQVLLLPTAKLNYLKTVALFLQCRQ